VLAVGLVAVLATLALLVTGLGQAVQCRQRAEAAADLAALAAASLTGRAPADRCARAAAVSAANRAALSDCRLQEDGSVTVQVVVDPPPVLARLLPGALARAVARAGPAASGGSASAVDVG